MINPTSLPEPDSPPVDHESLYDHLLEYALKNHVDVSDCIHDHNRYYRWLCKTKPDYVWDSPHLRVYQSLLESTLYSQRHILVSIPPRHSKTETGTIRFPNYALKKNPAKRIIVGGYGQKIANKYSREIRRLTRKHCPINREVSSVSEWETVHGGGVKAVGVGVGIAGYGGDLILIDDPFKNRFEASSLATRERVWDWFTNDIYLRREPGSSIVVTHTRWNDDDLIGRLLKQDEESEEKIWTYINFAALAEEDDPLGRQEGEALWPYRFDVEELLRRKRVMGDADFSALYQGRPLPRGGSLFKIANFQVLNEKPANIISTLRAWDLAGSEDRGDFTVGVLMGLTYDRRFVILDVTRGQWAVSQRKLAIIDAAQRDGRDTKIIIEREAGIGGQERTLDLIRGLSGFVVDWEKPTGSKVYRAEPLASALGAGNLFLMKGDWNFSLFQEFSVFPYGRHDDIVDACSMAYNRLASAQRYAII